MEISDLKLQFCPSLYYVIEFLKKLYLDIYQEELSIKSELNFEEVPCDKDIIDSIRSNYDSLKEKLMQDLAFYLESDPAIDTKEEVILAYPGLKAIYLYRVAHLLIEKKIPVVPRIISEYAHSKTGIDINPKQ